MAQTHRLQILLENGTIAWAHKASHVFFSFTSILQSVPCLISDCDARQCDTPAKYGSIEFGVLFSNIALCKYVPQEPLVTVVYSVWVIKTIYTFYSLEFRAKFDFFLSLHVIIPLNLSGQAVQVVKVAGYVSLAFWVGTRRPRWSART